MVLPLLNPTGLKYSAKTDSIFEARTLAIEEVAVCGVSNTDCKLLSQSEFVLELPNDVVTFTRGFFELPAAENLHCPSHVFYDSAFLQY